MSVSVERPSQIDHIRTPATAVATEASSSSAAAPVDAAALFTMGFEPEEVGSALVSTRGDAVQALELLGKRQRVSAPASTDEEHTSPNPKEPAHASTDEHASPDPKEFDDEDLALALKMSMEKPDRSSSSPDSNPLWNPPRYVPACAAASSSDKTLSLVERVEVRDGAYGWQQATAFMDTGNQHMTIVDSRFARRHAIFLPDDAATQFGGNRGSGWGQAERWTTLHGVVPGASSRAPCVTIALKVRGEEFIIQAAVSEMGGHDLLIGVDVLRRLFASGFKIDSGSI